MTLKLRTRGAILYLSLFCKTKATIRVRTA